jgi:hypothetical protein
MAWTGNSLTTFPALLAFKQPLPDRGFAVKNLPGAGNPRNWRAVAALFKSDEGAFATKSQRYGKRLAAIVVITRD